MFKSHVAEISTTASSAAPGRRDKLGEKLIIAAEELIATHGLSAVKARRSPNRQAARSAQSTPSFPTLTPSSWR